MPQKDYRCTCKCGHEFIAHESPAKCTNCGDTTQQCVKI